MHKALACLVYNMQEGKTSSARLAVEAPTKRGKQVAALQAPASPRDLLMLQYRAGNQQCARRVCLCTLVE